MPIRASNSITVAAGATYVYDVSERRWEEPLVVGIIPGAGGTGKVESSTTPTANANPGAAAWIDSGVGAVSANTELARYAPAVALRLVAATQPCVFTILS